MYRKRFDNIDRAVVLVIALAVGALSVPAAIAYFKVDEFFRWSVG